MKKLEIFRNLFRKTSSRKKQRRSYREGYKGSRKQPFLIFLIPDGLLISKFPKNLFEILSNLAVCRWKKIGQLILTY